MASPTQFTLLVLLICSQSGLSSHHRHHHHHHRHPAGDWTNLTSTHANSNSTEEVEFLGDSGVDHQSLDELRRRFAEGERPVIRRANRGLAGWILGKVIQLPVKIGKTVISIPSRAVQHTIRRASALSRFGADLSAKIISSTEKWFRGSWEAVRTIEFPGKNILVMTFPGGGIMSVVDRLTKEIMNITNRGGRVINQTFAYTIYASLRMILAGVSTLIKTAGLNCVKLKPQTINLNNFLVSNIHTTKGNACGLSHLKPVNNVTITRNDDQFLIINMPFVLNGISVDLGSVNVDGMGVTLLGNEPLKTTADKVLATGTVSFEAGNLLKLIQIHIAVDKMIGVNVTFTSPQKTYLMKTIEGMPDALSGIVTKQINEALEQIEDKVLNYIVKV